MGRTITQWNLSSAIGQDSRRRLLDPPRHWDTKAN